MKRCTKCSQERALEDFHRDRTRADGRRGWCKPCVREYGAQRPYDPERQRVRTLKHKYGISPEEYASLAVNGCLACGAMTRLVVDHDHVTGSVRGVLCNGCNVALGLVQDNPRRLRALARYIEEQR